MDKDQPIVFISYSHQDKEFARQLDTTLLANDVKTFLDEREILVGDSIPQKIYAGIAASTHLIYIVSASSINSPWVQEELSIGKMREKESQGFKILPVIIDDVPLPPAIVHIKYADFRQWQDSDSYRRGFLEILQAMQIEPLLVGREELMWYRQHTIEIRDLYLSVLTVSRELFGALNASQGVSYMNNPHYTPTKWAFEDDEIVEKLIRLRNLLADADENSNNRLATLKRTVTKAIDYARKELPTRRSYEDPYKVSHFRILLEQVAQMIGDLRSELEDILLASAVTS